MAISKLRKLLFQYDWEIVEIQGAIFKIVWGIWLFLPFDTFTGLDVYDALRKVTNETTWGIFVIVLGLIHLWAISSGVIKYRRTMIFVAFLFWIFISVVFGVSRIGSALIPLTIVIAFFLAVNYLRLGIPTLFSRYRVNK